MCYGSPRTLIQGIVRVAAAQEAGRVLWTFSHDGLPDWDSSWVPSGFKAGKKSGRIDMSHSSPDQKLLDDDPLTPDTAHCQPQFISAVGFNLLLPNTSAALTQPTS